jgi:carbon monoxide dehydrogenase subunit G
MATVIESNKVTVAASSEDVFNYLMDFNNIKELLPGDKISDWEATEEHCSFKIQKAATIPLVKQSSTPHKNIHIVSGEKSPFPFTLDIHISEADENGCEGFLHFEGEINPFLKMMVVKPLNSLFNDMARLLKEKFEN